jgi:hypothetical protein
MSSWSPWRKFPNPGRCQILIAPIGAGCYELKITGRKKRLLFGQSGHVASRMTSLVTGRAGGRKNQDKSRAVRRNLGRVKYRTKPCMNTKDAIEIERYMKKHFEYEYTT